MFRVLFLRVSRRRAVGTLIGGLIILTLILTALGMMIFVSQQYDQYQQAVNEMGQYQDRSGLENLQIIYPGLLLVGSATIPGWGSGCTTTYNCYNLTISNLSGVGIQIVRIYINSSLSGCIYNAAKQIEQPCVLNPSGSITPYTFNQANQFINAGEADHFVLLALPSSVLLPSLLYSQNTVFIATSRGNVFSFQWPLPLEIFGGQSQAAFSTGIIKVAYQDISAAGTGLCSPPSNTTQAGTSSGSGCDSSKDYSRNYGGASTWPTAPYCHNEPEQGYVAPTNYAEQLTGITGVSGMKGTTLTFVNPWITLEILENARTDAGTPTTELYIYINITNVGSSPYVVAGGTLDLTYSGSTHIDGTLIGIYYNATGTKTGPFWYLATAGQTQKVAVGKSFYAIFQITQVQVTLSNFVGSAMYWGSLSLTNNIEGTGFVGGVGLSSGFWIRYNWNPSVSPDVGGWNCNANTL
jgi:hypothetical protein